MRRRAGGLFSCCLVTEHETFPRRSDFIFGPVLQICDFLCQHDWKDAITTRNNPFTLAHNCPGETMFEYLYKNPKHVAPVTKAEAADVEQMAMDLYPWEDQLRGAAQDRVAIVDIAGSHGNATRQIMKIVPALKGRRFIVQDLEPVIQEHSQALRADGIEPQVYDFLKQAQPIRGMPFLSFSFRALSRVVVVIANLQLICQAPLYITFDVSSTTGRMCRKRRRSSKIPRLRWTGTSPGS